MRRALKSTFLASVLAATAFSAGAATKAASKVDFNRDVRPILSETCFACHGPDKNTREADLRLDVREDALKAKAFVPGKSAESELIKRITTADPDDKMPPPDSKKLLTPAQISILKRWIDEGANYEGHWAYVKPVKTEPPTVKSKKSVRGDIDHFIVARLEKEGLKPSREADRVRLIRRLSLDLVGLPPTPQEVDAFVSDKSANAYEKLVDRLMASPHFGERMTQFWLDLARYADTNGYHIDNHRDLWLWREWVINAFNDNMPFDRFTIEQLAGDLLPNPTIEQKIASGFNRNEMVNFEGGADPNEYAVKYIVGRVDATSRAWLGTTMACAECHDHKYDPVTQNDYYRFFAFFNTIAEQGLDGQKESPAPRMKVPSKQQQSDLDRLAASIKSQETNLSSRIEAAHTTDDAAQNAWEKRIREQVLNGWKTASVVSSKAESGATLTTLEDGALLVSGTNSASDSYEIILRTDLSNIAGLRVEALPHESFPLGKAGRGTNGGFVLTSVETEARKVANVDLKTEPASFGTWYSLGPFKADSQQEAYRKVFPPEKEEIDLKKKFEKDALAWTEQKEWKDGVAQELKGDNSATYLFRTITAKEGQQLVVSLGSDDGIQVWLNGKKLLAKDTSRGVAPDQDKVRLRLLPGENKLLMKINNGAGGYGFYFNPLPAADRYDVELATAVADASRKDFGAAMAVDDKKASGWSVDEKEPRARQLFVIPQQEFGFDGGTEIRLRLKFEGVETNTALGHFRVTVSGADALTNFVAFPDPVRTAFFAGENQSDEQKKQARKYYRENFVGEVQGMVKALAEAKDEREKLDKSIPVTMVMQEMEKPRDTHLLIRGDWQSKGDKVTPNVPASLPPLPAGIVTNRLALAKWLTDPQHPLTSRVTVNRFWQQFFGAGIVRTPDDFGAQGEWPSHPELLDYLAVSFVESGWDMKALIKSMVMSGTYRQESVVEPKLYERDPENRLLARGPRFRLDAEAIRDQALAVSGLLNKKIGGASVNPYQPSGLWEAIGFTDNGDFSSQKYVQSKGDDNYRRGIYTYWKRSMPYASFVTFDAPNRETCTVKRPRTNTPLQALVLMNDPVYVEAARALGERVLKESSGSLEDRLRFAFRVSTGRKPSGKEMSVLKKVFEQQRENFQGDIEAAKKFITIGESKPCADLDPVDLATWTAVSNVLLNLEELVTRS